MLRQPEIGSALGLSTAEVVRRATERADRLRETRERLISELVVAQQSLTDGVAPLDVVLRLHEMTGRMLEWQS